MAVLLLLFTASLRLWCAVCKLARTVASAVAELVKIVVACCCWAEVSVSCLVKKSTLRCARSAAEGGLPERWAKVTVVANREVNRILENTFFMVVGITLLLNSTLRRVERLLPRCKTL